VGLLPVPVDKEVLFGRLKFTISVCEEDALGW
jgi:hypothetical protein